MNKKLDAISRIDKEESLKKIAAELGLELQQCLIGRSKEKKLKIFPVK